MTFQLKAKVIKSVWNNEKSWLYKVEEQNQDRTKSWSIFCEQELIADNYYQFEGTVSESKDKKVQDANGKDIYRANFNAQKITASEDVPF